MEVEESIRVIHGNGKNKIKTQSVPYLLYNAHSINVLLNRTEGYPGKP